MGRNLPIRTRRLLARGLNRRHVAAWARRYFWGTGGRATLTTALAGANNDVTLIARTPGTAGNSITFRIVVAGVSTPASVGVVANAITFNSATNAGSAATSTAADVVRLLNLDAAASLLVWTRIADGNDGTGVVAALAVTNLTGGAAGG